MPFLDSQTIRPLYDVHDGGPPVGYRCRLITNANGHLLKNGRCDRVTRTLNGMRSHQRIVHGIRLQQEFQFDRIQATTDQQDR
jgi:hypothetical protein